MHPSFPTPPVDDGASHPQHPRFGNYATLRYGIAVEEMRQQ